MNRPVWMTRIAVAAMAATLLVSGCATVRKSAPASGAGIGLEMEREQYVVLDTVTGSCDTVHFLLFFNNHMFSSDKTATVGPSLQADLVPFPLSLLAVLFGGVDDKGRATYNALQKVPEADTIVPLTVETKAAGLNPLFWTTSATVKGKAVKIKSDSEL